MLKVGLLTFHRAVNYGAVLQTYALQEFMIRNGAECEVIDFRCRKIEDFYRPFILSKNLLAKSFFYHLYFLRDRKIKNQKFESFINKYLHMTPSIKTGLEKLDEEYDIFVVGSDQVFNPDMTGEDALVYYLNFTEKPRFSYAASFGKSSLDPSYFPEITPELKKFKGLSVREESGAALIKELIGRDALVHVDPTLLLGKEDWHAIVEKPKWVKGPYIFVYDILSSVELFRSAERLQNETKLPVVFVNIRKLGLKMKFKGFQYNNTVSPNEFLWLIENAEYVLTSSFHGLAFSIFFQKRFLVVLPENHARGMRLKAILDKFEIYDHLIYDSKDVDKINGAIDWEKVDICRKKYLSEAKQYIKDEILSTTDR